MIHNIWYYVEVMYPRFWLRHPGVCKYVRSGIIGIQVESNQTCMRIGLQTANGSTNLWLIVQSVTGGHDSERRVAMNYKSQD